MNSDSRKFPFVIAAGGMQLMPVTGERFAIYSTTGPVDVSWTGGKLSGLEAGEAYRVRKGFAQLILNNTNATPITGVLMILDDDYTNNRIAGSVTLTGGTNFVNTAPAVTNASAALLAANANRTYVLIQNNSATGTVYLNFSAAATVGNGIKLTPGGIFELGDMARHLGAINAIGDIANNPNVIVVEG